DAHELATVIGVTIAGACRARLDVAHHRTRIAADLVTDRSRRRFSRHGQAVLRWRTIRQFVRIRMILRAKPCAVKRGKGENHALPNNRSLAYRFWLRSMQLLRCERRAACTFVHK